jgi:hypothetical protein
MGGGKPRQTHPAAMDIDYTDGLGAGNGANIMRITALMVTIKLYVLNC